MPESDDTRVCAACGEDKPLDQFAGKAQKCKDCDVEWTAFRHGIDDVLDADRPDRAGVNESEWRERAYAWARNHMPNEAMLIRQVAVDQVNLRERNATRRGNNILRRHYLGQIALTWEDVGFLPIRLEDQHIRLDASTPADLRKFSREIRATAKQHYDAQLIVADEAEELAELATQASVLYVRQIGNLPPRGKENAEAS